MHQPHQLPGVHDLYKTDLDRHLFTPARRRPTRQPPAAPTVAAMLRVWWQGGWSYWKSAITYVNLFLS